LALLSIFNSFEKPYIPKVTKTIHNIPDTYTFNMPSNIIKNTKKINKIGSNLKHQESNLY